jgi:hypothetical protein
MGLSASRLTTTRYLRSNSDKWIDLCADPKCDVRTAAELSRAAFRVGRTRDCPEASGGPKKVEVTGFCPRRGQSYVRELIFPSGEVKMCRFAATQHRGTIPQFAHFYFPKVRSKSVTLRRSEVKM